MRENTITSSMYARHVFQVRPCSTLFIRRWKVPGAFLSPNGILLNSNRRLSMEKAVLQRSSGAITTCQKALSTSKIEKNSEPAKASAISSMRGSG